jgi:hypothetical protein
VAIGREAVGVFQRGQVLFGAGFPQMCFQAAIEGFDRWRRLGQRSYR